MPGDPSSLHVLDLNGPWQIRWWSGQRGNLAHINKEETDERKYFPATVPGEIHLDLIKAGVIEEPTLGVNVLAARWVEEMMWGYRRHFTCPKAALKPEQRAWLCFEGLDYAAVIFLNGQEIGRHSNSFTPARFEVTGKLKGGQNLLTVHLDSGLFAVADKQAQGMNQGQDSLLHKRHWLRKPQSSFEWDWSPRLLNIGITRGVRLEWTKLPLRADQFVPLAEVSADLKTGTVRGRWFIENISNQPVNAELALEVVEAGVIGSAALEVKPGVHFVEAVVKVADPHLWWPIGHGKQERYTLRAKLAAKGSVIGETECRIGFRHVRVNQDAHAEKGRYFILEINGKKIFAKGGNFVPADIIFQRIDAARYHKLVDLAIEANFNMLRVWGGGLYEASAFFDYCDEKGILVWQEFIYACARYPTINQAFFDNAKAEATHHIRRLARHPSLVVWCGNNELEVANWHWGYDKGTVHPDYAFFHLTLPRIMAREDPTRYYQPSSPYSPNHMDPNLDDIGDQHPWSVGMANTDFRDYRQMICRFPNEGGVLGPTALPTMLACLPEDQRSLSSFAWQVHENSIADWGEPAYPDEMLKQWLGKDVRDMSVEDFTYWAGLIQGEGLREYVDNFHRRMFDSAAAIFWMYNDCWPATRSWTIVDYYLRRTPAFGPVKRAMAPVNMVLVKEENTVTIFGINETEKVIAGRLRYGIFNLSGGFPLDETMAVELRPNESVKLGTFPLAAWTDSTGSAAFAVLTDSANQLLARNRLILPFFKELRWPKPRLTVRVENGEAIFESPGFVWGVCLDLHGERALSDNFFDVYPGIAYRLPWKESGLPKVLRVGNLV